jgi:hypothetical protein
LDSSPACRVIPIRVQDDKKPSPKAVIPAKAGIQAAVVVAGRHVERADLSKRLWIPAFAGMTGYFFRLEREME